MPEEYIVKRRFRVFSVHFRGRWPAYVSLLLAMMFGVGSLAPWKSGLELDVTNYHIKCTNAFSIKSDMHFTLNDRESYKTVIDFSDCDSAMYDMAGKEIRIVDSSSFWGVIEIMAGREVIYSVRGRLAFTVISLSCAVYFFCLLAISKVRALWKPGG